MNSNPVRNRRLGLVLLVSTAIIAIVLLFPGVALGLQTDFAVGKATYKVGETVTFTGAIILDAEEIANIQAVILNVDAATSTKPGSESFTVDLPINEGVRIHYELEGDGPALVLHHGFSGSLRHWYMNGYVEALRRTYRLILVDARGHGESDKPHDPASYALATHHLTVVRFPSVRW